ncbi:MAG: hypothetical protein QXD23_03425 [Candidatus Micrarchaeaceae archaeon]
MMSYKEITDNIAQLLDQKEQYYGPTYKEIGDVYAQLFKSVKSIDAHDLLAVVRMLDKIFRIVHSTDGSTKLDAWNDIAGYAILQIELLNRNQPTDNPQVNQVIPPTQS